MPLNTRHRFKRFFCGKVNNPFQELYFSGSDILISYHGSCIPAIIILIQ